MRPYEMKSHNKIEIRCKKCGKLHLEIELAGKLNYRFSCKSCKYYNTNSAWRII